MLGYIRDSIQGWIAWFIVVLLIIPFALWGINEYFGGAGPLVVATVNGEEISQQSYQQAYLQQRNRMQQMLGAQFDASQFEDSLRKQALDDLIDREVLFQTAESHGYRVSDQQVIQTIQSFEAFQEAGVFSNEVYKQQLRAQGESAPGFENRMKRAILTQQLYSGITGSSLVTEESVERLLKLQEQKREIAYMEIDFARYKMPDAIDDDAIASYYDKNKDKYKTAETVSVEYIELDVKNLGSDEEASEEQLRQMYEDKKDQYMVPGQRRTRHILITVDEGADQATLAKAKEKIDEIKAKLDTGEDFAKLAETYSQDPGSAKQGGDIGFFGAGNLDPNYDEAMFSMKVGEVSEPVLSAYGYHIIKLEEVRNGKTKTFEEVREELANSFKSEIAAKRYFELAEKLTNLAYEVPDSLQDAAGSTGLEIKTSQPFARTGGIGIAANPRVVASAFSEDVLKQGYNSEPIEIGESHVVVLRVKEHKESEVKPLEEVKDQIRRQLVDDAAKKEAQQVADNVLARLTQGDSVESVISELNSSGMVKVPEKADSTESETKLGDKVQRDKRANKGKPVEWKNVGELMRTDRSIDAKIIQQAFKLSRPEEGKPQLAKVTLNNGNVAVMSLIKVIDGDPKNIDKAKKLTLKRNLASIEGQSVFKNTLKSIKENAYILIEQDNL